MRERDDAPTEDHFVQLHEYRAAAEAARVG
jgi:hypothetical protein